MRNWILTVLNDDGSQSDVEIYATDLGSTVDSVVNRPGIANVIETFDGVCRDSEIAVSLDGGTLSRVEFEAGRLGMDAASYVRKVIEDEVGIMPRWSFEIEFDPTLAEFCGTDAEELYERVDEIASRMGNKRIGRGAWMAVGDDPVSAQCATHSALRRAPIMMRSASRWVAREDDSESNDIRSPAFGVDLEAG